MRDDFNIQFATQNLLEDTDIDETSTTSGVGVYHRKKGERTTGGMIYKDLWEAEEGQRVKISDKVQMGGETGTVDQVRGGFVVVKMDSDGKRYSFHSSDVEPFEDEEDEDLDEVFAAKEQDKVKQLLSKLKDIDYDAYKKLLMAMIDIRPYSYDDAEKELSGKLGLAENYSRFKNETKTRGKADQFHQAIREVKKRVHEINKVFEYVNRLKEELNEGGEGLKYKKHTEAAVSKIKEMVSELNTKIKKFK